VDGIIIYIFIMIIINIIIIIIIIIVIIETAKAVHMANTQKIIHGSERVKSQLWSKILLLIGV
jgi:uncharacterized membrane protein